MGPLFAQEEVGDTSPELIPGSSNCISFCFHLIKNFSAKKAA